MPDFNQKKPGETLTKQSEKFRKDMLTKNIYPVSDSDGYSSKHPNAMADGDDKGRGSAIYLDVFGEDIGTRTDIMGNGEANTGRINNVKTNLYNRDNEYSAGNLDSGPGYKADTKTP